MKKDTMSSEGARPVETDRAWAKQTCPEPSCRGAGVRLEAQLTACPWCGGDLAPLPRPELEPGCPSWCEGHVAWGGAEEVGESGGALREHGQWQAWRWRAYRTDEKPVWGVFLWQVTEGDQPLCEPHVRLTLNGFPRPEQVTLQTPAEVRELAQGLLRAAELMEAAMTAHCPSCGGPAWPAHADKPCIECDRAAANDVAQRRAGLRLVGQGRRSHDR